MSVCSSQETLSEALGLNQMRTYVFKTVLISSQYKLFVLRYVSAVVFSLRSSMTTQSQLKLTRRCSITLVQLLVKKKYICFKTKQVSIVT